MKSTAAALALILAASPAWAQKSCDELKSNIAAKLESRNVKGYQLEVVDADARIEGKIVGSCEHGKRKIVYRKA